MRISVVPNTWPVVRVTFPRHISLSDVEQFAAELRTIFRSRGPMITVSELDGLDPSSATALIRRKVAEEADKLSEEGALLGEGVVVNQVLLRGIFRAYSWLKHRPHPMEAFATVDEALAWAQRELLRGESARRA